MNDLAASGQGIIRQRFSFKSRGQRDAGSSAEGELAHDMKHFLALVGTANVCLACPPRVAGRGINPTGGNKGLLRIIPVC